MVSRRDPACLDDELIARFASGQGTDLERATVEAHVDTCAGCRRRVAALAAAPVVESFVARDDLDTEPVEPDAAPVAPPSRGEPRLGDRIGRFVTLRVVGRGGMGVVVAAHDPELDRQVAIKLVRPAVWRLASAEARELLRREARAMARLVHPHVVTVHDLGTVDDQLFVAMELVDGASLDEWRQEAPRTWRELLDVCVQAGRGIAAAHRAGLVHRDVKPHNVLVDREGRARIADFGLAALVREHAGSRDGTPAYMSPEQHGGRDVGPASDQFSFCVMVHEALFGVRPFPGATAAEIGLAVEEGALRPPPRRSPVPARIRRALVRGLSRDPAARFPTMEELLAALAPRAGLRRVVIPAALAIAAAAGVLLAGRDGEDPDAAARRQADAEVARVWSPARQAELARGLAATGAAHAAGTIERASAALDRYAADWIDARVEAAARNRRGDEPPAIGERRAACLRGRLRRADALIAVVAEGDATGARNAVDAIAALPAPAGCLEQVVADELGPPEPARRARHDQLRSQLAHANALSDAGRYQDAIAAGERIAAAARELDHPALVADVMFFLGTEQLGFGAADAADRALTEAIDAAARAGDDHTIAQAWVGRVEVAALQGRLVEAEERLVAARAAVRRAGDPDRLRLRLLDGVILVDAAAGRPADGERHAREAVELARRIPMRDFAIASSLRLLATMLGQQQRRAEALPVAREALAYAERALGPDHPELALYLTSVSTQLSRLGEAKEAIALAERAAALATPGSVEAASATLGLAAVVADFDPARAIALARAIVDGGELDPAQVDPELRHHAIQLVGRVLYDTGVVADALVAAEAALALGRELFVAEDARLAASLVLRGQIAAARGELDVAEAHCGRADALIVAARGADDATRYRPLACKAHVERTRGRRARAVALAEQAVASADRSGAAGDRCDARLELARALRAAGDRRRAAAVLEEAAALEIPRYAAQLAALRDDLR